MCVCMCVWCVCLRVCLRVCVCVWCILITAEVCPQATHRSRWTAGCGILETASQLERWWCVAGDGPCMTQGASPAKTRDGSVEEERGRGGGGRGTQSKKFKTDKKAEWMSTKGTYRAGTWSRKPTKGGMKANKKKDGVCWKHNSHRGSLSVLLWLFRSPCLMLCWANSAQKP